MLSGKWYRGSSGHFCKMWEDISDLSDKMSVITTESVSHTDLAGMQRYDSRVGAPNYIGIRSQGWIDK